MRARVRGLLAVTVAAAGSLAVAAPAGAAAVTVSVTALHLKTSYRTTDGLTRQCDVSGDLYVPSDVSATHRDPAILTTNGFGGSKADQSALAQEMGLRGYVTLSYSGLGFGGSGCPITDDDPDSDGQVATQLVSFLGGASGIGYTSFDPLQGWTGPVAPLTSVQLDACDHSPTPVCGAADAHDPRLGMVGGSYGGQIQFAAAGDDPRIDTIVPLITWNDLSYSLDPGSAGVDGHPLAAGLPGVGKTQWDSFFFGLGVTAVGGVDTSSPGNPQSASEPQPESLTTFGTRDAQCPGFQPETCVAEAQTTATGAADTTAQQFFTHSSVASYLDRIRVPVFLGQGEHDTLFNLTEAATTYRELRSRKVPVKMFWQSWGHSQIGAAPGEYPYGQDDSTTTYAQTYQGAAILALVDHYLRGNGPAPSLDFSYFRDWAYTGSGTGGAANEKAAAAAYAHAASYPLTTHRVYDLSGTDALVPAGSKVATGAASLTAVVSGHTSYSNLDAAGVVTSYSSPLPQPDPSDVAGTVASWTTPPLTASTDVVGIPTLDVTVVSGEAQAATDARSQLVLFAKLYDVAADGTTLTLPARLVAPARVPGTVAANAPVRLHLSLPGIVHRFAKGDALRVVLASGDDAYSGNFSIRTASFPTSAGKPAVLTLPVAGAAAVAPVRTTPRTTPPRTAPPRSAPGAGSTLPTTGAPAGLAALGAVAVAAGVLGRRRRSSRS